MHQRQPGGQQQRHRERDPQQRDLGAAEPGQEAVVDEAVVAGEAGDHGVLQQEEQADGGEDLRERIAALHAPHEMLVDQHPEDVHHEADRHDGQQRIEPEAGAEPPGGEHPEHEELAVGEVDHLHEAPDDRQPHGDEGVEKPHLQAVDDGLGELGHGEPGFSALSRAAPGVPGRLRALGASRAAPGVPGRRRGRGWGPYRGPHSNWRRAWACCRAPASSGSGRSA